MMDGTGTAPDAEALAQLQEQLADAQAQLERLQGETANAEARTQDAVAEAAGLRDELGAARDAHAAASAETAGLRTQLDEAGQRNIAAAQRYRDLVVRSDASLPADLIAGDDIDAVDASVAAAREIVGRVRSHIESQAQAGRVPAGAPPRSAVDLSSLTPEQKIRYGLARRG
jgi:chromosome segregation ATPase